MAITTLAVVCSPVVCGLLLLLWKAPPPGLALAYFGWLFYFLGLTLLALLLAWAGVSVFHALTPELEEALTESGRRAYDDWAERYTSGRRQVVFAITFTAMSCAALAVADTAPGTSDTLYVSAASYISVAITAFMISSAPYWIIAGSVLSWILTRRGRMTLSRFSPASTPGLESLARCYRLAFYGSCVGVAACLVPFLNWAYSINDSQSLTVVKFTLFLVSVTTALAIAIVPQWFLSQLVSRTRRREIGRLNRRLTRKPDSFDLDRLTMVVGSKSSTVSESATVGLLLGLGTVLLPYGIRILMGA